MRITTEDIYEQDDRNIAGGIDVVIDDYITGVCIGSINVDLDNKGKLVITHHVYTEKELEEQQQENEMTVAHAKFMSKLDQ